MAKKKTAPITILLVDDHVVVRKGLVALIELEPDLKVVGEAENGEQAITLNRSLKPTVVIMDLAMPKLNGIEAARQIKKETPAAKILVLSAHADDVYIEKTIELKLSGYLIKQCAPIILVDALRSVAAGKNFFSPKISERMRLIDRSLSSRNPKKRTDLDFLSAREAEVLQLVAEGKANKQIAADLEISIKTVEKHRQNLMNKLGIHDTAGLTRYAIAEGYITVGTELG
jgi:DNA-binding NarL/FixJ family response regulator